MKDKEEQALKEKEEIDAKKKAALAKLKAEYANGDRAGPNLLPLRPAEEPRPALVEAYVWTPTPEIIERNNILLKKSLLNEPE